MFLNWTIFLVLKDRRTGLKGQKLLAEGQHCKQFSPHSCLKIGKQDSDCDKQIEINMMYMFGN